MGTTKTEDCIGTGPLTGTPLQDYSPEAQRALIKKFENLQWALTFMERYEKKHGKYKPRGNY